jgi:PST family polysaccharide transporter
MWPGIGNIIASLKEGWAIFVTIISSTLLGNTNIFILGLLCDNQSVGYYAIADKIIRAFINIVNPISVAIFPITSKMISQSKEAGVRFVRRVLLIGSFPFVAIVAAIFILAGAMVSIISGHQSQPIIILLRIMAVLPLTIFIDNLYGTQILVNIGRREQFMKAVLYPGIFSLLSSLLLVPIWKEQATAVIYVVSEIAVLTIMVYFVKCEGIYLIADGVI